MSEVTKVFPGGSAIGDQVTLGVDLDQAYLFDTRQVTRSRTGSTNPTSRRDRPERRAETG